MGSRSCLTGAPQASAVLGRTRFPVRSVASISSSASGSVVLRAKSALQARNFS